MPKRTTAVSNKSILVMAGLAGSLLNFRGHLLSELVTRGWQVHVCAPEFSDEEIAGLSEIDIQPHAVALQRVGMNPFQDLAYLWRVMLLCRRLKVDVCLAYTIKPVIFGLLGAWLAGVKRRYALITGLGYAFSEPVRKGSWFGGLVQGLYRISLARCQHVIFQNPDDRAQFSELGLVPPSVPTTVVNGSGVDLEFYKETSFPDGPISFLMISRLLGAKGVRVYAAAAIMLRQEFPEVECRLAGWPDANHDAISQNELNAWQRDGAIKFLGKLADVRPAIGEAIVYVLPSYYREGTPRTVLEAMSMGRPIVTTDAPGCKETVVEGLNGYLVPIKNSKSLLDAMRKFVVDPSLALKMGKQSRAIAEEKYDVHIVNKAMLMAMKL
jgi:glycosyltransferase involved in cell wall biosynthesis